MSNGQTYPSGRQRVLVVDDNAAASRMLGLFIQLLGGDVRTAGNGEEAIVIAEEFQPQVILMDIRMPRMNGYEAARYIRDQDWGTEMVLVALTGLAPEECQPIQSAGFDCHLVKPVELAELEQLLSSIKSL